MSQELKASLRKTLNVSVHGKCVAVTALKACTSSTRYHERNPLMKRGVGQNEKGGT